MDPGLDIPEPHEATEVRTVPWWVGPAFGLLALGVAGCALLIAADLSTLVQIKVVTVVKQRLSGMLTKLGNEARDLRVDTGDGACDYPDYAIPVS